MVDTLISVAIGSVAGISAGALGGWGAYGIFKSSKIRRATDEANEIVGEVKEELELRKLEEDERIQEIELELWGKVEGDLMKIEERIEELQDLADEKKLKVDEAITALKKAAQDKMSEIQSKEAKALNKTKAFESKKSLVKENNLKLVTALAEKLKVQPEEFKEQVKEKWIVDAERFYRERVERDEEELKGEAEAKAKRILSLVIDRFARPYCPERGIASVHFPDPSYRKIIFDDAGVNIKTIQEVCGCDIYLDESTDLIGVAGYDPVRRELTRRTLERLLKEKRPVKAEQVRQIAENQRKELLKNIKADGDALAREMKLEGLHPEIRQMMGSLRHRYSFTQNQFFHCGEVGWLASLMAAELKLDIKKARRVGMLHDIGKAMDHNTDGGHAVIGAAFIAERGEHPDVVHAVKAHHFDEQPNSDHAFLVIAADAVSGARPGARRSTMESYTQKVTELQDIAHSFPGVTDCFVLSGGRECRVMVNSKKVDDMDALQLSKKIAKMIEEKCNYPGQIKVVIVRETYTSETTKNPRVDG